MVPMVVAPVMMAVVPMDFGEFVGRHDRVDFAQRVSLKRTRRSCRREGEPAKDKEGNRE